MGIIDIIVAMAILTIVVSSGVVVLATGFSLNRLSVNEVQANALAQEGIEAVRSIQGKSWSSFAAGNYGLTKTGGQWNLTTGSETIGQFTRTITIAGVGRNAGNLVDSGGTPEPDAFKVTSQVAWNFNSARSDSVSAVTYLTNYAKTIGINWANATQQAAVDLTGTNDGLKIAVSGNYAYVTRVDGTPDFMIIDVSNPGSPVVKGTLALAGQPNNIVVSGNYAYIASSNGTTELQVIDVSNVNAPTQLGSYDAAGTAAGLAVAISGNTVYLTKASSGSPEIYAINVANPAAPTLLGSLELGANSNAIVVSGSYAYVASGLDTQELQIINIANPAAMSIVASYNAPGNQDALSVAVVGSTVILGRTGNVGFVVLTFTAPSTVTLQSTTANSGAVNDIDVDPNGKYIFLATASSTQEFIIYDITILTAPTLTKAFNASGIYNGVAYSPTLDRAFVVGAVDTAEFIVYQP